MTHAEIEELLGAYALDAVDPDEARAVEEHLASCPRCRAEVAAHREVAAMLGNAGGEAPEGLWERIAGGLDADVAELPPLGSVRGGPQHGGPDGARRGPESPGRVGSAWRRPLALSLGAVAAALAVVVGLLAAQVTSLNDQVSTISSALGANGIAQLAALAAADPSHHSVQLTSSDGRGSAVLVALPSGQAYWITEGALRALPAGRTYQLWALANGRVVSIGLLGGSPKDVPVQVASNMTRFMVTAEPLGGATQPTSAIVLQGRVHGI
jgi:anti-sigma factor RsiW